MLAQPNRCLFAAEVQTKVKSQDQGKSLTYYKDGQLATRSAIVLKKKEDIESYVVRIIQGYFRTTYKSGMRGIYERIEYGKRSG